MEMTRTQTCSCISDSHKKIVNGCVRVRAVIDKTWTSSLRTHATLMWLRCWLFVMLALLPTAV